MCCVASLDTAIAVAETSSREIEMPVITFDRGSLDEGFMFLARRGEVGCLPNETFVITDELFDLLKKSHIPFTRIRNHQGKRPGGAGAEKTKSRKANGKVSV